MALRSLSLFNSRTLLVSLGIGVAGWIAACGSSGGSKFQDPNLETDDGGNFGTSNGFVGTSSGTSGNGDGGDNVGGQLRIEPATITITATGTLSSLSGSQEFKAFVGDSTTAVTALWSVDDAGIGSIDGTGLFKTATIAGKTKVIARVGNYTGTAIVNVLFKIEENPGSVDEATKTALRAGGTADVSAFKWIYPYDKTVFPRGLLPPKLMFAGATPASFYVRLSTKNVDYAGFYPGSNNGQPRVIVSNEWWNMVTRSAGVSDPVTIQVTKIDGAKNVTGPISETWSIAQGSLKGTVFYNTYNSTLVQAAGARGAVMRLKPGSNVEVFIGKTTVSTYQVDGGATTSTTSTCTVCHSVSANGSALVAGLNWGDGSNPFDSAIFSISTTGQATPRFSTSEGRQMPFGGLSPDGNWLVGNASPFLRGLTGTFASRLYNGKTGAVVDDSYFGAGNTRTAIAPAFSPDSQHLAYGDRDLDPDGHRLSILDVTPGSGDTPPSFANNAPLALNPSKVLGWPSFLPDSQGVLYGEGTRYDTAGHTETAQLDHYCGDLQWVERSSKLTSPLNALNGYNKDNSCYLPFCDVADPDPNDANNVCKNTEDAHMNYEPTVLPTAVGGYYWVVFTSRRAYGNFISRIPGASVTPTGDVPFDNTQDKTAEINTDAIRGYRKKLWVAAIDIGGAAGTDISHPAFLLEGQEIAAGNMRGFWALDPCKPIGNDCETGNDCCGGFCRAVAGADGGSHNACVVPPTGCANESEKCSVAADCCDNVAAGTICLNGFCSSPPVPPIK